MAFAPDENIYALAPDGEEPHEVIATSAREHSPALSPDGRWIAYVSDETGRFEVYVARFPEGDRRTPITANGGFEPLWSRGGQELFFTEGEPVGRRVLRAVSVSLGETLELGEARTLFVTNDPGATENVAFFGNAGTSHDVSADGTRFLMIRRPADPPATEIVVVQNWFEELKRIVPTN
jgi:Tol biopolymer transport system component